MSEQTLLNRANRRDFFVHSAGMMIAASLLPAAKAIARQEGDAATPSRPEISPDTIAEAEKLIGVEFTPEERAMIAETVAENIGTYVERRKVDLPNELGPLSSFKLDPRDALRTPMSEVFQGAREAAPQVPAQDEDIAYAPLGQLARWINSRQLTSETLTEVYLDRIKALGPTLECVVTVTEELAMEQAQAADRERSNGQYRGPLHGIPYGLKDLFDTSTIKTTWGAEPWKDRLPTSDSAVTRKLRDAGAVLVAKTTLGALAYGDIWFGGRTNNPWNLEQGSSGSSAGSASGTAAGLYGFSIGTETLGSIVSPSMRCGTTGLRPTFGRVSREGAMALCWSLDKVGPICRRVEDCIAVLNAMNGSTSGDPGSVDAPIAFVADAPVDAYRVGYNPAWFEGPGTTDVDRNALEALKHTGVELVEVELPDWPYGALYSILITEAAAAFERMTLDDVDDQLTWQEARAWPNTFRSAWFIPAIEFMQAERFRRKVANMLEDVISDVDVLFGPSFAASLLLMTNFTGHPQLCLRAGFNDDGTPRGVSFWGHHFDEGTLCRIGMALENELGVWDRRPEI